MITFQMLESVCNDAPMCINLSRDKELMRVIVSLEGYTTYNAIFINLETGHLGRNTL